MSKKDGQAPTEFPEKWNKVLKDMPEFRDIADAASEDDLKKIIVTCEGNIYTIDQAKAGDIKLNGAKELVKEYSGPYNDAIKAQTAKVKYALFLLEGKGIDVGDQ